ncbi:TPA: antirestriction protein ArdR [Escherichia coli]|uniref:Antirestriction protein ArdR n=2 Tax=Salmonella enterica I TaxID=59201 RepID=A0A6Y5ISH5_SALET|nr:antirestriction protein ArdR [Salmonella enterica subsp. enterica serovar Infantis]MDN1927519.1 antirestriction protein ArdR [Escherichia coli]HAB2052124.1 antirestriction protein ArdR [Salmonella enterica subsp. enterica serovar Mbandaka]HAB6132528.1 antirestriction protein ArdR [Salmonella enterica subsp. enterica]HCC0049692.1 antirestriction protein ArdR [Salmonella enterica subsp. enterica serovar Paratyphi B]
MTYQEIAARWRADQPEARATTGVVLVWKGEVYGWKNTLRDAAHEQPGAVAVDVGGNVFRAEGGDACNGAKCWVAVA